MKKTPAILITLISLLTSVGCQQNRWQVTQTEFSARSEKTSILLDSQTGEVWSRSWDSKLGYVWVKEPKIEK